MSSSVAINVCFSAINCQAPPSYNHMTAIYNITTYGNIASYVCSEGLIFEDSHINMVNVSCLYNGSWNAVTEKCIGTNALFDYTFNYFPYKHIWY